MDKQTQVVADERTPMSWERFLYEHPHPMAERFLREYQEKHTPIKASGAEHLGELVRALQYSDTLIAKALIGESIPHGRACEASLMNKTALSKLPPELRGES